MATVTYIPVPYLEIGGETAPDELMNDIQQLTVEESLHLPAAFTIVIENPYYSDESPWRHDDYFTLGQTIRIGFQASTTADQEFSETNMSYLIQGEITGIESHFSAESQAPIIVRGYDTSHRLHRGRHNRSFQDYTDSDIVAEIAAQVGLEIGQLDDSGDPRAYVFQENQTNMEFLRYRAARLGFELFVRDGQLYFRRPTADDQLALQWLQDFGSFQVRVTTAEQVSGVEVRAWDYLSKQAIVSTAESAANLTETEYGQGSAISADFGLASDPPTAYVVDKPVESAKEADAIAQALFDELGGEFTVADAQAEGNPDIRAGRVATLEDMGQYDGEYYITETRHLYYNRRYTTEFAVRGLRGGNLLGDLMIQPRLRPGQTFLVGIVTNNQDPEEMGRVRVRFPTLSPQADGSGHESNWARVVAIGAGSDRGFQCLPEIEDEVLVGFEHGDIHRPYVLGNVWNGEDAPPDTVADMVNRGKVRLRTLRTRTGHQLQFVEEDQNASQAGISLETASGAKVSLNDSTNTITLETPNGHRLSFSDSQGAIKMQSYGGHEISLDDTMQVLSIRSTGSLSLQATTSVNIQAIGSINLNATVVNSTPPPNQLPSIS
ncbi:MAG: VgrG-related protein [Cyanobacteria bacterium P01_D01_bin.6]